MERTVTKLAPCHVQVEVDVEEAKWKEAQAKAFKKLAANLTVDGFRKGKAPEAVARKHLDPMKIMDEAINGLLPSIYREVLKEEKLEPYAQPSVDVTKLSDSTLGLKFVVVTAPEIELGNYKDLEVGKEEVKVEEKEVEDAVKALLKENATLVVKEGEAKEGDTLVFDFVGKVGGEAFEGGTASNYELTLGSHTFIPGFEEQLIGVKAGEHRDINVTFPKEYTPELAGKEAVFECDVHEVKEEKLPELTDEFVKELGLEGVETVDALKENKKQELLNTRTREARGAYLRKLYEEIAKGSKVEIPEEMVEEQKESMKQDLVARMAQSGLTLENYLQFLGQSEEDFEAKIKEDARKDIANYFILLEVGKKEEFMLSDADVEFEMAKLADQYKMTLEDVKKALKDQMKEFKRNIEMTRIEEFLYNNNK